MTTLTPRYPYYHLCYHSYHGDDWKGNVTPCRCCQCRPPRRTQHSRSSWSSHRRSCPPPTPWASSSWIVILMLMTPLCDTQIQTTMFRENTNTIVSVYKRYKYKCNCKGKIQMLTYLPRFNTNTPVKDYYKYTCDRKIQIHVYLFQDKYRCRCVKCVDTCAGHIDTV